MSERCMETSLQPVQRVSLGDWTIWSLSDGYLDLDQRMFVGLDPEALRNLLTEANVPCVDDLTVRTEVHGYLIDTGKNVILVDTGCGKKYGVATGNLINQIRCVGYNPEQISLVLITHIHPDHIGGLLDTDGIPTFPNATLCVSDIDATYWRDRVQESRAKEEKRFLFDIAREMLAPYERNNRLRLFHSGESIIQGITAIAAPGHTLGHMAFVCCSQNEGLLLWGDIVHTTGMQFSNPELYIIYDVDGKQAVNSRKTLFAKAADQHLLVGGAHLPLSGLGYVHRSDETFSWQPLERCSVLSNI